MKHLAAALVGFLFCCALAPAFGQFTALPTINVTGSGNVTTESTGASTD